MQLCLSNYTIPRVVQLKKIVLCCRRNARFPMHSSPQRKFQKCTARVLIRPARSHTFIRQQELAGEINVKSNQIKSNQIKSNQIKSNQIKSNQIKSNQIKSNQIKSNQIKSNQIKSNLFQIHSLITIYCRTRCTEKTLYRAIRLFAFFTQLLYLH